MADRDIDIVMQACREFSDALERVSKSVEDLKGALDKTSTGIEKLDELYRGAGASASMKAADAASVPSPASGRNGQKDRHGALWYFERGNGYKKVSEDYRKFIEERIGLAEMEFTALDGYNRLLEASVKSRRNVESKAYKAMQNQLLRLIEIHKFSAGAFARAVTQQVKVELTGLAARAAIWAIFETAMGLRDLAVGSPTAALHFKSAAEFGAVAGASLAAAAGVQEAFFGGQSDKSGSVGTGTETRGAHASINAGTPPMGLEQDSRAKLTQNITVQIYNPLSDQNWQKIVEDNIVPALNSAAERNVSLTVRQAY